MASFFSYFNPVPQFPSYTGPHAVGTTDLEVSAISLPQTVAKPDSAASTVAFRLYYPCQTPTKDLQNGSKPRPVRWIPAPQSQYLTSIWRFLGLGPSASAWLTHALPHIPRVSLPAHRDAPITRLSGKAESWPVMIFSHGLGGSRNAYSYLCGCLASHGIVVAAPDHRDGSQSIAYVRATDGEKAGQVEYKRYNHQPNEETFRGRDEQLKIRIWELSMTFEALAAINKGGQPVRDLHDSSASASTVLAQMKAQLDLQPGSVTFAGHSFGGTTAIQLVKSAYYCRTANIKTDLFSPLQSAQGIVEQTTERSPVILLDPWGLPLKSPATSPLNTQPMPAYQSTLSPPPLLAVMSQAFHDWRNNRDQILTALSPPPNYIDKTYQPEVFYPVASAHLSQSDFGILFPRLTKYLAKAGEPRRLIDLNVRAILETLRRRGLAVESFDLEKAGEATEEGEWVDLGETEAKSDGLILDHEADAVKGWRYVPLSGEVAHGKKRMDGKKELSDIASVDVEKLADTREAERRSMGGKVKETQDIDGLIDSGKA